MSDITNSKPEEEGGDFRKRVIGVVLARIEGFLLG